MKLLFIVGLLSTIAVFSHAADKCHMSELGKCIDIGINWWHGLPKRSLPATEGDLDVMCKEVGSAIDCGMKWRDSCMTPLQKEVIGLLLEGVEYMRGEFCKSGTEQRNKYLKHAQCFNKVSQLDAVRDHLEYMMAMSEAAEKTPVEKRLSVECCAYQKSIDGLAVLIRDNCGQEAVDAAGELLGELVAQLPSVVCNGYDPNGDQCKAVLPPAGAKGSEHTHNNPVYKAMRDLLKNFLE